MQLAYRHFSGPAEHSLIILHGLLGSSRNWLSVAKNMQADFNIYLPDLRNHGQSPHHAAMDFSVMAADITEFIEQHNIIQPFVLGHSLGGKVAMRLACAFPDIVRKLVVVDIAPRTYAPHQAHALTAMQALNPASLASRKDADDRLADAIPDWGFRQFILTNLTADLENGGYKWSINLPAIIRERLRLAGNPLTSAHQHGANPGYSGPTLFVRGEKSDFISDRDFQTIQGIFPQAVLHTQPDAGHDPHVDDRVHFVHTIRKFLLGKTD